MFIPYFPHQPFNARIKSFRATLPAEIFLLGILMFKGLIARRIYKSLSGKWLKKMHHITSLSNRGLHISSLSLSNSLSISLCPPQFAPTPFQKTHKTRTHTYAQSR
jgi:hypothetical protein